MILKDISIITFILLGVVIFSIGIGLLIHDAGQYFYFYYSNREIYNDNIAPKEHNENVKLFYT